MDWQYRLENLSIWFQGGVRRWILIFAFVCLVLVAPGYFFGILAANIWNTWEVNPHNFRGTARFNPKVIAENDWSISRTEILPLVNGQNDLYISLSNKENLQVGYFPFVYTLQILDSQNAVISQEKRQSYLLPGEVKFITATSADSRGTKLLLSRENQTQSVYYNPNSKVLRRPNVSIISQNLQDITFTDRLRISATLKNEDQVKIGKLDILYLLRDNQQSVVGVGEFTMLELMPGEQQDFSLEYIKPLNRNAKFLDLQWSVNYLDPENLTLI